VEQSFRGESGLHPGETGNAPERAIPSGSLRLDAALGTGGIPRGWITEIFGTEQAGKTTLCLLIAAAAQRQGGLCAWVDADHTLDPAYAIRCGVDPDLFFLVEPQDAGQALAMVQSLVQSNCLSLVVVDSAGALVTEEELNTPLGQGRITGLEALLSRSLPGLAMAARNSQAALVFTNRSWPGTPPVYHRLHSQPEKLALKLHAAIRLQAIGCQIADGQGHGNRVALQLRCIKNKFSENCRAIQLDIVYNEMHINTGDIFDLSSAFSIIDQRDSRFYYQDYLLGESRAEAIEALLQNRNLAGEIEKAIRRQIALRDW
jgi:recombination protein RecA